MGFQIQLNPISSYSSRLQPDPIVTSFENDEREYIRWSYLIDERLQCIFQSDRRFMLQNYSSLEHIEHSLLGNIEEGNLMMSYRPNG